MGEGRDPAVRMVEYDPGWPAEAARELRRVGEALGGLAVRLDHVGSTSVPGLAAKPIVDLQVSVAALGSLVFLQEIETKGADLDRASGAALALAFGAGAHGSECAEQLRELEAHRM